MNNSITQPNIGGRRSSIASVGSRRSSSEVIKRMLYGSATKEDLKNRNCVDESDSDLMSDDTDSSAGGRSSSAKYFLKKTSSTARLNFKLRRNSVEDSSERDASPSPPLDSMRAKTSVKHSRSLPRRTKSSSNTNITSQINRKTSYAFGSSTERFCNKQENDTRSSQDNLSGSADTFLDINYINCQTSH